MSGGGVWCVAWNDMVPFGKWLTGGNIRRNFIIISLVRYCAKVWHPSMIGCHVDVSIRYGTTWYGDVGYDMIGSGLFWACARDCVQ